MMMCDDSTKEEFLWPLSSLHFLFITPLPLPGLLCGAVSPPQHSTSRWKVGVAKRSPRPAFVWLLPHFCFLLFRFTSPSHISVPTSPLESQQAWVPGCLQAHILHSMFQYCSGTWKHVWMNSFPPTRPTSWTQWNAEVVIQMSRAFLSRAVIKVDIITTLLISKKNHKYICKILERKLWKMHFPSLKVFLKIKQIIYIFKKAPKKQPSWNRRNTFTS